MISAPSLLRNEPAALGLLAARRTVDAVTTRANEQSDQDLIDVIASGDQQALTVLYRRYGRLAYGMALRVLGEASAAEEVTQDVFQRVWEKAASYRPDRARVSTWLMRIARNRAIDVSRKRGSAGDRATAAWDDFESTADTSSHDPAEHIARSHCRDELRTALATLPDQQRRALALAFLQGLTHRKIAELLGEPLGTVKARIRDAMRKLRGTISEECAP
jgi:RNA polymerase sigma-70 factor, ECF subfamily